MKINPLLQSDFYKQVHWNQYPKNVTKVVSYLTPRGTRIKEWTEYPVFGFQGFIKEFLIEAFYENFFNRPKEEVISEYKHVMDNTLGENLCGIERIGKLHDLGYLPIEIKTLEEGTMCPTGVPMLEISNTHPDFAWLTNALETLISCEAWHAIISAKVGVEYRKIVNKYYDLTCDDNIPRSRALGDFAMRGQESAHSAMKSSAAWLLSFVNTATVPAIMYLEKYYNCDCEKEPVGFGSVSTEHSVMCSNYAVDGDEITMIKRLLTEIYPNTSFSMVSDSYDYWNLVDNILPQCKKEIMNHNGKLLIRGDSGDPVEVVVHTVEALWEMFGGTINSKGYKILDKHIGVIYGDSITLRRAERIYEWLKSKGFAANNVSLGVGSFSMQCFEEDMPDGKTKLNPFTRDTSNMAIKCTYCEDVNGNPIPVFKNPKEMSFKKSHKGCCIVSKNQSTGMLEVTDNYNYKDLHMQDNLLKTVFVNGKMVKETSLKEIRAKLHKGEF